MPRFPTSITATARPFVLLCILAAPVVFSSSGCKGGSNPFAAFDPRAQAMAALSEHVKTAAKGYLSGLNGVLSTVASANDFSSALSAAEKLRPYYDDVVTYLPELQKLRGEDLENVRIAFGPELKKAEADLKTQIERLSGSTSAGSVLKPLLERVQVFR
ncbi:MAG: hypothetical protein SGJ11_13110 [Phycisphaerae bacterium]|nr:hypothetical protein [Phycisphaerae bacterium]